MCVCVYVCIYIYIHTYAAASQVPPLFPPKGYGSAGAMFPAPPCGWVGGGVVVVVSHSE